MRFWFSIELDELPEKFCGSAKSTNSRKSRWSEENPARAFILTENSPAKKRAIHVDRKHEPACNFVGPADKWRPSYQQPKIFTNTFPASAEE
jgi:hypothetical protein